MGDRFCGGFGGGGAMIIVVIIIIILLLGFGLGFDDTSI
jgi:hypothetical protein